MKKRKSCWFCDKEGKRKTFRNRSSLRAHLFECHEVAYAENQAAKRQTKTPGKPNVVHYGKRMRRKLGLEYSPTGHLRSTLIAA